MTDKKTTDGTYVVLQLIDGTDAEAPAFRRVAEQQAHRPEEALKIVCGTNALTGRFLVMPSRSYRLFDSEPTTVVQVKAVE